MSFDLIWFEDVKEYVQKAKVAYEQVNYRDCDYNLARAKYLLNLRIDNEFFGSLDNIVSKCDISQDNFERFKNLLQGKITPLPNEVFQYFLVVLDRHYYTQEDSHFLISFIIDLTLKIQSITLDN